MEDEPVPLSAAESKRVMRFKMGGHVKYPVECNGFRVARQVTVRAMLLTGERLVQTKSGGAMCAVVVKELLMLAWDTADSIRPAEYNLLRNAY